MRVKRMLSQVLTGSILLLFTTVVAACGSSSTATGSTATGTPTATSCFSQTVGTIQSINSNALLIATTRGTQIRVTYTSKTIFLRQATLTTAALKEGVGVTVRAVKASDNSYSAVLITLRNASSQTFTTGSRPSTGSVRSCSSGQRTNGGSGQGHGNFTGGQGGTTSGQSLAGTIAQLIGNTLTINDATGTDYTVELTSSTQIMSESTAAASDLQVGKAVTVVGTSDNHGGITASQVVMLLKLPTGPNTNSGS